MTKFLTHTNMIVWNRTGEKLNVGNRRFHVSIKKKIIST